MSIPFERFLHVRHTYGGTLGPDNRLAFLSNMTGVAQLWRLDAPQRWPEQLTFDTERVTSAYYNPTRPLIAFLRDRGGNEMEQVFVMDENGAQERLLTNAPDRKHIFGGWSPDGAALAWSANTRRITDFDVYVHDLESGETRRVYEGEGWHYAAAWLPDGEHLLIGHLTSNTNNDLYLLNLRTGETEHLTPHTGDARYYAPRPTPDGRGFFLLCDEGREFLNLAFYDLHTRTLRFLEEHPWDRTALDLSHDGAWLAMVSNEDGISVVQVGPPGGPYHDVSTLDMPIVGGVAFAPRVPIFTLTVQNYAHPMDVWVADAVSATATRWSNSSRAGLQDEAFTPPERVHFRSFDGLTIPAFYFRPRHTQPPYPVVIYIHGGPESQFIPSFNPVIQFLANAGYAILAPNVRGSTGYGRTFTHLDDVRKRMDAVADLKAAYEWLVNEGQADPHRIALMGGSYGGFMVLAGLTTYPELWAAGVDIVGIANFVTFLENTGPWRRKLRESEYGSLEHDREFLESISPINHVDRIRAPLMVIHGANDPRVPLSEAEQIVAALRAREVPVEYLVYQDEGHGLARLNNRLDAYPRIAAFLDRYVKNRSTEQ